MLILLTKYAKFTICLHFWATKCRFPLLKKHRAIPKSSLHSLRGTPRLPPLQTKSYSMFGAGARSAPLRVCEYNIATS